MTSPLTEEKDLANCVKITWFGHSMFVLEDEGHRLVMDPYQSEMVGYSPQHLEANIITVSHEHGDHNNIGAVNGSPVILNKPGSYELDDLKITGLQAYHDERGGSERGANVIFRVEMNGLTFIHLGDLGHVLKGDVVSELSGCDVLLVPVGGIFTIDADGAEGVVKELRPRIAVPMHYGTPDGNIPLNTEEAFIARFPNVDRTGKQAIYIRREELPEPTLILVMDYVT